MAVFFVILILLVVIVKMSGIEHKVMRPGSVSRDINKTLTLPWFFRFTPANISYVYVQLSVQMMKRSKHDLAEKRDFVYSYVKNKFHTESGDFRNDFLLGMRNPVELDSLCKWLIKNLKEPRKRVGILHFLVGVGLADGALRDGEIRFLKLMTTKLGLQARDLDAILNTYYSQREEQRKRERDYQSRQSQTRRQSTELTLISRHSRVLGVAESAGITEIKKAYRKLVKIYHPDRQIHVASTVREAALEKFRAIQEAYEYLEKVKQ